MACHHPSTSYTRKSKGVYVCAKCGALWVDVQHAVLKSLYPWKCDNNCDGMMRFVAHVETVDVYCCDTCFAVTVEP